jgi:hypothetical protein
MPQETDKNDSNRERRPSRPLGPYCAEQDENGVDLSLIRENLKLTPLERARKAERLRRGVLRMHELARVRRHQESA